MDDDSQSASVSAVCFRGRATHSVDPKHRFVIPAKWRDPNLSEYYVGLHSSEKYLKVMPQAKFDRDVHEISADPSINETLKQATIRHLNYTFQPMPVDSQGRMGIPEEDYEKLQLENKVLLIGTNDHFEVWNPENYPGAHALKEQSIQDILLRYNI